MNKKKIILLVFMGVCFLVFLDQGVEIDELTLYENSGLLCKLAETKEAGESVPPRKFTSDACSLFPNELFGKDIGTLCIEHDISYWAGGNALERKESDLKLRNDVNLILPVWGDIMYWGIRVGGSSLLPTPWRWGYGYPYFSK